MKQNNIVKTTDCTILHHKLPEQSLQKMNNEPVIEHLILR